MANVIESAGSRLPARSGARAWSVGFLLGMLSCAAPSLGTLPGDGEPYRKDPELLVALGYKPLFDGKSLKGWVNPFEHGEAKVLDGELRLRGDKKFFLVTDRPYADFRLVVEIHLPEGPANSGVMFRCHAEPGRVFGYQAECDGSDRRWSGGLYDEGRRQWVWPSSEGRSEPQFLAYLEKSQAHFRQPEARNALRRNDWNRYEITCIGDRIRIRVNGVLITNLRDSTDQSGLIGIQHHGEAGQVYRFRNLYLKELPEIPARTSAALVNEPARSVERLDSGGHLVDFGRVAFGNLRLTPPAGSDERLVVRFGEKLRGDHVDRQPPGTVRYREVAVDAIPGKAMVVAPPADGRNTGRSTGAPVPPVLTPPEWGVVMPFRWIEIEGLPENVPLGSCVRQSAFPRDWDEAAAEFTCSDETLNKVWDLCRYSIKATAFAGVYVDGDRERIPYEADAYLNQLCHYFVEGDAEMARRTIDWLIEHPTWPTEWGPHVVFMAYADWMQTGDVEWLKKRYPVLRSKVLADRLGPSGFVESTSQHVKKGDIVDWPVGERDGFDFSPINSVVNAFHLAGVDRLVKIARAVGAEEDAAAYAEYADRFRDAFHDAFFDESAGRYRDGIGVDHHSQHASFFPLAFAITPPEHRAALADKLAKQGMRCSVYGAQYLLEALFESGSGEAAVRLITAPGDRSWSHMLNADATITWEAWDVAYKNNLDWNHAWGAAPANLLPRYVLGVQPLSPGWRQVQVHPTPCGLSHARGVVPSPRGPLRVDWQNEEGFCLQIGLPDGVAASVKVPASAGSTGVRVDGRKAAAQRQGNYWVLEKDLDGNRAVEVY